MKNRLKVFFGVVALVGSFPATSNADVCYRDEQTGTRQQCSTSYSQSCHDEQRQECRPITRRECSPWDRQECRTDIIHECFQIKSQVCEPFDREVWEMGSRKVCTQETKNVCGMEKVCKDIKPVCEPGKPCPNHIIHECKLEKVCKDVPYQACKDIPEKIKKIVHDKKCHDVFATECKDRPETHCTIIHDQKCRDIADQECSWKSFPVCQQVPSQNCVNVPVFGKVPYECGPKLAFSPIRSDAKIYLNGAPLSNPNVYSAGDHLLVPIRALFEAFGATVDYRAEDRHIIARFKGHSVEMTVDSLIGAKDGQPVALDVPPIDIQDSVYIPLRFASESLNAKVDWVQETNSVFITSQ